MAPEVAPYVLYGLLAVSLTISLVTDLRQRKILDVVTFPTLGLALTARLLLGGWDGSFGLASGVVGALAGFGVFFLFAFMGGMGMGDVKLVAAVGGALGWPLILAALLFIAIAGGVQAILTVLFSGKLIRTLQNLGRGMLRTMRLSKHETQPERHYVPYGVAIFAGTLWAVLWQPWIGVGN